MDKKLLQVLQDLTLQDLVNLCLLYIGVTFGMILLTVGIFWFIGWWNRPKE